MSTQNTPAPNSKEHFIEARAAAAAAEARAAAEAEWERRQRLADLPALHEKFGLSSVEELIVALAAHLKGKQVRITSKRRYHRITDGQKDEILQKIRDGAKRSTLMRQYGISSSTHATLSQLAKSKASQ